MFDIPIWDGLRKVYSVTNSAMDAGKVGAFTNGLNKYLSGTLLSELSTAILEGPIHSDSELKKGEYRGSLLNRVQSYLWKKHGIQFEPKCNILNDAYSRATKCEIPHDLYGSWDKSFNWTPGDFGDGRSCFWTQHSETRYFLKHWDKAIAFCLYQKLENPGKDIKERVHHKTPICQSGSWYQGYGRCWVLIDYPHDGCIVVFNSYPSGDNLTAFSQSIMQGVALEIPDLAGKLQMKQVSFLNDAPNGGWFYTNNSRAMVIGTPESLSKIGDTVVTKHNKPRIESYEEYGGSCCACGGGRHAWKDRPSLSEKQGSVEFHLCEQCVSARIEPYFTRCGLCGEHTFYEVSGRYEKLSFSAKLISNKSTGAKVVCCPECHNHLDRDKYSSKFSKEIGEDIIRIQEFQEENYYDQEEEAYEEYAMQEHD